MLANTQSIICAFGLASAAPRSPYRHLELCGIALGITYFSATIVKYVGKIRNTLAKNGHFAGYSVTGAQKRPTIFVLFAQKQEGHLCRVESVKAFPLGEGGALARRMRGKYPAVFPSSVTCGDSFPQRGKPYRWLPVRFALPLCRGRGMPRPRDDFLSPCRAG